MSGAGAILASASSKDIEFALENFRRLSKCVEEVHPHVWRFTQQDGTNRHCSELSPLR